MKIKQGDSSAVINTISNWTMLVDLFVKWGYSEELLEEAKINDSLVITVSDIDRVTGELSAWGIPWKRTKWSS